MSNEAFPKIIANCGQMWMIGMILLTSGLILAQCCGKKKGKKRAAVLKNEEGKNENKNKKKKKKTKKNGGKEKDAAATPDKKRGPVGPNPRLNEPRGNQGVGEGMQYQTLGNLDKDIFARGQDAEGLGNQSEPAGHPKVPPAAGPNAIDDAPQGQEGFGEGLQYQSLGTLDTDIFARKQTGGNHQPAHQGSVQRATPENMMEGQETGGPGGAPSVNEGPIREGIGEGKDYQTWVNLDQNLFVNNQQQRAPAAEQSEAQTKTDEAAPREGIGQGPDYQTWIGLDNNVFLK